MRVDAQNVEGKEGEENRECDWGAALREICKEWEENGEQQHKIGVGDCRWRKSERKVRKNNEEKGHCNHGQPHP